MSSRVSTGCDVQPRPGRPKLSTQHGRVQVLLQGVVVKMNLPEAGLWFQRAASQGFPDAMHNLSHERPGRCGGFHSGCKNITRCCKAGLPDTLFALGVCFQDGRGVRKDMLCTSLGPGCSRRAFRCARGTCIWYSYGHPGSGRGSCPRHLRALRSSASLSRPLAVLHFRPARTPE